MLFQMSSQMKESVESMAKEFGVSQSTMVRIAIWSLAKTKKRQRHVLIKRYIDRFARNLDEQ